MILLIQRLSYFYVTKVCKKKETTIIKFKDEVYVNTNKIFCSLSLKNNYICTYVNYSKKHF